MLIFNNKTDLKAQLAKLRETNSSVGFVPTMGALHNGHLSLLKESVKHNSHTVISIFVNPTQFNNPEDLEKYPRTLETDVDKIKTVSEKIIVFAPSVKEMYEDNITSANFSFDGLENQMEGRFRPGHFDGVGTIVKKLFEIVEPDNAYFGEKDFQQLQIVKKMVEKNNMPVNVVGCPILREENGLAMSSRNQRLSDEDKTKAALIYKTLNEARQLFDNHSVEYITKYVNSIFKAHPEFEMEYFEVAEEDTLLPATIKENKKYRAFIAVFLSNIRLIDNISLN